MTHCPFCGAQAEDVLLHMATDCPDRGLVLQSLEYVHHVNDVLEVPDENRYYGSLVCPCGWGYYLSKRNIKYAIRAWDHHLANFPDPIAHFVLDSVHDEFIP
jgi:hypothetical protein